MNASFATFLFLVFHLTCSASFVLNRPFGIRPTLFHTTKLLRAVPLHDYQTIFRDRLNHFMETGNVKMPTDGQGDDWALRTNYIDLAALEELLRQQDETESAADVVPSLPSVPYTSKSVTTSQAEYLIEQRIKKAKESKSDAASSAILFSSILHEMKDKAIWNIDLLESVMLHIAKLEAPRKVKHTDITPLTEKSRSKASSGRNNKNEQTGESTPSAPAPSTTSIQNSIASKQVSALKLYIKAVESKDITALRKYILSLYLHNSPAATPCVELLLPLQLISKDALLPGEVCASIHAYGLHRTNELEQAMHHQLAAYYTQIDAYALHDTHLVLRTLSRYQFIPSIFMLLRYVRESRVLNSNVETIELLSQSLVRTVSKGQKAESMAELPKSEEHYPEVLQNVYFACFFFYSEQCIFILAALVRYSFYSFYSF